MNDAQSQVLERERGERAGGHSTRGGGDAESVIITRNVITLRARNYGVIRRSRITALDVILARNYRRNVITSELRVITTPDFELRVIYQL